MHYTNNFAKLKQLNLIEVGILECLKRNRGRLLTIDLISNDPVEQHYIHKYIGGLAEKGFVEKVGEGKYKIIEL
ncbi:hypothetical protein GLV94_15900 [Virgibacillus halodenitrificans]|uniref:hypothetical protein n=1 Tax=Virgibacillus halodenitrificans TaxID=1482 RepID=UPI001367BD6A|nr:hypothetical protein [Virgibacillus halodenitrificans]MYL47133.1 hypothetical protein [Virgibacillus halodenitrificans]